MQTPLNGAELFGDIVNSVCKLCGIQRCGTSLDGGRQWQQRDLDEVGRWWAGEDILYLVGIAGVQVGKNIIVARSVLGDERQGELGLDLHESCLRQVCPIWRKLDGDMTDTGSR